MKEKIQARIDKVDIDKLTGAAKKRGHTVSSLVRHLIKVFLNNLKKGEW